MKITIRLEEFLNYCALNESLHSTNSTVYLFFIVSPLVKRKTAGGNRNGMSYFDDAIEEF